MKAERIAGAGLQLNRGPWDKEGDHIINEYSSIEQISHLVLGRKLELYHNAFPEKTLESIEKSKWLIIDNGQHFLEIRNPDFRKKLTHAADIIDYDDVLFKSTQWHKKEYELIEKSPRLQQRGIHITQEEARELYQLSKIKIPGKVDLEPRYTPLLNLLLLTRLSTLLEKSADKSQAWTQVLEEKKLANELISRTNEQFLSSFPFDQDVVDIFANNTPSAFRYDRAIELLFSNVIVGRDLKVIVTRGKIEGPLGQVYKLHSSIMDQNIDLVIYTNDLKVKAILFLSRLFPEFQHMAIRVYDDNPQEILPYTKLAFERGIENLKVIHVRHPDAQRKDYAVGNEQPTYSTTDKESGTIFDHYIPYGNLYAVF
ncbi:MAG TPA: hypothetical protein VJH96_03655 [Patescibacteria group bacterium]|nr:hypothetical protein [Patescibacteria group bacterium]